MLSKIYRKIFEIGEQFLSKLRIYHLRIKYPKLKISMNCYIGRNCKIVCTDDSEMILKDVYVSHGSTLISSDGALVKMTHGFIGPYSNIVGQKEIQIGDNFSIAEMVVIRDQNHQFDLSNKLLINQGYDKEAIVIGSNVWIASKVTILKGVTIGNNVVIGANSLVNKNVECNSLAVGIPAKVIK